jgi:hypothetical protein
MKEIIKKYRFFIIVPVLLGVLSLIGAFFVLGAGENPITYFSF